MSHIVMANCNHVITSIRHLGSYYEMWEVLSNPVKTKEITKRCYNCNKKLKFKITIEVAEDE